MTDLTVADIDSVLRDNIELASSKCSEGVKKLTYNPYDNRFSVRLNAVVIATNPHYMKEDSVRIYNGIT